jgi:hypothetical protein
MLHHGALFKKGLAISLVLFCFLALSPHFMPSPAKATGIETGCALTPDKLDGQGLRVTGLGLRVTGLGLRVTGLGLSVTGLGLRVTGLGTTPEQIVQDIVNNPVTPAWLTSLLPDVAGGYGYNQTPVIVLIADDFSAPGAHGFEVRRVFDDLFAALDSADDGIRNNSPNIRLENINIGDPSIGFQTVGIASSIRDRVNALSSLGYKHFVINMSFGVIPCDSTEDVTLVDSSSGSTFHVTSDFSYSAFQSYRSQVLAPGSAKKAVIPIVECVEKKKTYRGTSFIAYFGYNNENAVSVTIPVGHKNFYQPGSQNSVLPDTFGPGRQRFVFKVEFDGNAQAWVIKGPDGKTRSATASSSPSLDCAKKGITPPTQLGAAVPEGFGLTQYMAQVLGIPENFIDEYLAHLAGSFEEDPIAGLQPLLRTLLQQSYTEATDNNSDTIFAVIPVASSGNDRHLFGPNALAPARFPESIATAATLGDFGPRWVLSQDGNVMAPGAGYPFAFDANGNITEMGAGTSFSAPFVSMLSALWLTYPNACTFGNGIPPLAANSTSKNANAISRAGMPPALACTKPVPNAPPVLHVDQESITVDEGQTAINTGTISDADSESVTLTASTGEVINNNNGTWSWSYLSSDGPAQSQIVTITANDGDGGITQRSFSLTVNNIAPTADFNNLSGVVNEGTIVTLAFSNMFDPSSFDSSAGFSYSYDCTGSGTFEPVDNPFPAIDCSYAAPGSYLAAGRIKDKDGGFTDYTASVMVNAIPVANDDTLITDEDISASVNVLLNDTDLEGGPLTVANVSQGMNGTVINNGDGTVTYTPNPNFYGNDSFVYLVCDPYNACATANVLVTVNPVNDLPALTMAQASVTVAEGQTAINSGTVSDVDSSYVLLTASVGTVINNGDGTWSWSFITSDGPAESQNVTIFADDGSGGAAQVSFILTVNNVTPVVDAGTDQTVSQNALVTFSGTFSDPGVNDSPFAITWDFGDGSTASGTTTTTHSYGAAGIYTVTLIVIDKDGGVGTDSLVVTVLGATNNPPICTAARPSVEFLSPPNHQMVDVNILGVTDPDGNAVTITITSIFQDEPVNGVGDGDRSPDGAGVGTSTAQVRAERSGRGDGRVYLISFTASDGQGGSCSGAVKVGVKHDNGKKGKAIDSGTIYDSTLP